MRVLSCFQVLRLWLPVDSKRLPTCTEEYSQRPNSGGLLFSHSSVLCLAMEFQAAQRKLLAEAMQQRVADDVAMTQLLAEVRTWEVLSLCLACAVPAGTACQISQWMLLTSGRLTLQARPHCELVFLWQLLLSLMPLLALALAAAVAPV